MAELIKYGGRSTGDLLKTLTAMGIDPAPKANDINNKRNVLSTMLSRAKGRFYNDRAARVWRVKKAVHLLELTKSIDAGEASG